MRKELIERIEVGAGGAASIEFTSIPQDGVDLLLKVSARCGESDVMESTILKPNNQTTNLTTVALRGSGSTVISFSPTEIRAGRISGANSTANTFGNSEIYISNYSAAQAKSFSTDSVGEDNGGETAQLVSASLWNDNTAITSLVFEPRRGGNFVSGSTASLYKVVNE